MEKAFKIVHGIKLVERTCTNCPLTFWVPKSSKTVTCSEFCFFKVTKSYFKMRGKQKRKKFTDKVKRSDHA